MENPRFEFKVAEKLKPPPWGGVILFSEPDPLELS